MNSSRPDCCSNARICAVTVGWESPNSGAAAVSEPERNQIGAPAVALAQERPNPMLNGHQAWLDGLAAAAAK